MSITEDFGQIVFSPRTEEWIEYGPPEGRVRVGFHDYATIYGVPGLYEAVFYDELEMCSADEVVALYAAALKELGRPGAQERVFDLGAGNGIGGEVLRREIGPGTLVGLDLEPVARAAAERDRPGTYDDYLIADLATSPDTLEELCAHDFSALVAVSAIGEGHIPLELLATTVKRLLRPGGLFAFAVFDGLLPAFHDDFFALVDAERLGERSYSHRRQVDGTQVPATAVVARRR
jgi:predicted TPR repeat methyltransferase